MSCYFTKTITASFEDAVARVDGALKKDGFSILTDIDVQAILKRKMNTEFRKYRILDACNPPFASSESQIFSSPLDVRELIN